MKTKDIARQQGFDGREFDAWFSQSGYPHRTLMMGGLEVDSSVSVDDVVAAFRTHQSEQASQRTQQEADQEQEQARIWQAISEMQITTGFSFEGYRITRYAGYISGDSAVQVDRGTYGIFSSATDPGAALMNSMGQIRQNALIEMKVEAVQQGCNAIIGVDFDYLNLAPETAGSNGGVVYLPYVFGVTANGTAVSIEKEA
ncbi:heavy metal-binding domain-containing protein [Nakamurella lactea]|uniref:heavy metal-binding domain-containing protein n=1 Tax=Nakamurella lactea TaxID=459515 RepID=UPI000406153B|nr:heavy metal-binding domain-containing protein [Nakamurella lactea]